MCIMEPSEKQKIIDEYMPQLEEFIKVDERIISPKTLSHLLHVNHHVSRLLIEEYHKKHKDELYTWYILCGERKTPPHYGFHVCSQDKMDSTYSLFKSEPSISISSIQKLGVDTSVEAKIASDLEYFPCHEDLLPVRLADVKRRNLKTSKSATSIQAAQNSSKESKPKEEKQKRDNVEPEDKKEVPNEKSLPSKPATSTSSNKQTSSKASKGSIGQLFGKQAAANAKKPQDKEPVTDAPTAMDDSPIETASKSSKSSSKTVKGSIGQLFGKQAAANAKKPQDKKHDKAKESKSDVATNDPIPMDEDSPSETPPKVSKGTSKSSTKKKKPKKPKKSNDSSKKRKRIMAASDSESDEDEGNEDDFEEEPLEEPPPQPVFEESDDEVIPPTPVAEKGRKRVRKQIDKTYEDEDGFIITKKEFVYESCSDSNDASPAKKPKTNGKLEKMDDSESKDQDKKSADAKVSIEASPKKPAMILAESKVKGKGKNKETSPQKSKQTSLMNFFKKK